MGVGTRAIAERDSGGRVKPEGMPDDVWAIVSRLTRGRRYRVLERSAIMYYATKSTWEQCDRAALRELWREESER